MAITVERVRVEGGSMDFADLSLVLPFATFIKDLNGSASGLSSSPDSRANLKFEGGVGEFGPVAKVIGPQDDVPQEAS